VTVKVWLNTRDRIRWVGDHMRIIEWIDTQQIGNTQTSAVTVVDFRMVSRRDTVKAVKRGGRDRMNREYKTSLVSKWPNNQTELRTVYDIFETKIVVQEIALHRKDWKWDEGRKGHDRVVSVFITGIQARIEVSSGVGWKREMENDLSWRWWPECLRRAWKR